ncbi:MAG: site-specific DNA-methyltransferase [Anaeroplasmataceae bacterium]|nr:site-specific DNA-methyltransferase [Anaeroplasmataceae bacterium]
MQNECNIFEKFTKDYLSFKDYKNDGLNGICMYPAMMIDEMQKELLQKIVSLCQAKELTILDPFYGSGTTLLISKELKINNIIGFDINPLANLITSVKLENYDYDSLKQDIDNVTSMLKTTDLEYPLMDFQNIDKWFRNDIKDSLSKIHHSINCVENISNRKFLWAIFSNVVRKYSNSRSSTFKLHIKEQEKIDLMTNDSIDYFIKEIKNSMHKLCYEKDRMTNINIYCGDSLNLIDEIPNESVDIVCTSPPYGDNQTTVTYGQFSTLALRWIDSKDLDSYSKIVDTNYSSIDNHSLGGSKKTLLIELKTLKDYLLTISTEKQQKVINFVSDYSTLFEKMAAKMSNHGYMILTVGNRKVDNKLFPFVNLNHELADMFGLNLVQELKRDILKKRMAKKVSRVDNQSVESMSEEYILIYRKERE